MAETLNTLSDKRRISGFDANDSLSDRLSANTNYSSSVLEEVESSAVTIPDGKSLISSVAKKEDANDSDIKKLGKESLRINEKIQQEKKDSKDTAEAGEKTKTPPIDEFLSFQSTSQIKLAIELLSLKEDKFLANFKKQSEKSIDKMKKASLQVKESNSCDWGNIGKVYEYVFSEYEKEITAIAQQLSELEREKSIWLDSALFVDEQKSNEQLQLAQNWIIAKEAQLNQSKKQLLFSVNVIKDIICGMEHTDNDSG